MVEKQEEPAITSKLLRFLGPESVFTVGALNPPAKLRLLALAWNVLQSRTEQGVSQTGTVCHIEESALITQVHGVMSRSLACFSFSMISRSYIGSYIVLFGNLKEKLCKTWIWLGCCLSKHLDMISEFPQTFMVWHFWFKYLQTNSDWNRVQSWKIV